MKFSYLATDSGGKKQNGSLEANSKEEVLQFLRSQNLIPISIEILGKNPFTLNLFNKIKKQDITLFTRELSSMLATGLTLIESLNLLKKQINNPKLVEIITDIIENVSEGKSFSLALSRHADVFSGVYIALIKAAETQGLFDKILARLADNLEKAEDLKKKITAALFYPSIVILGVIGVIFIMNVFVIPQLDKLYQSLNVNLPFLTQIVLSISHAFTSSYQFLLIIAVIIYTLIFRYKKTERGRKVIDQIKLKIPIIGNLIKLSVLNETTKTLSLLIGAGSPITEALQVVADTAGNIIYKEAFLNSEKLVERGIALSDSFEKQGVFPQIVIQMTKVGEATGRIDQGLERVASYFERDIDYRIKTLTTSIEPILIIGLGLIIGLLIFAVISPIYGLISQIQ